MTYADHQPVHNNWPDRFFISFRTIAILISFLLTPTAFAQLEFVGDKECERCHKGIYKDYIKSGHPYKLQKIDGAPPTYPKGTSPGVPTPPEGMSWGDISYVIGGYAWKARFMDQEGYILTGDNNRQYNLANPYLGTESNWSGYDAKKTPRKPYTCGACHTTDWTPTGKQGPHQDGLPGIYGTWAQPGITCEGCHGPGSAHVSTPENVKLSIEERCGDCHKRGEVTQINAKGGLIRHHEQYEDLLASPHKYLKCISCHDPHKSVKYDKGGFKGIDATCLQCHSQQTVKLEGKAHQKECTTCHMPRVAKSAMAVKHKTAEGIIPEGDVRGHIFRISTDHDWEMFTEDGRFVEVDDDRKAYLTVDRACLTCHKDKSRSWAFENAEKVH